MDWLNLPFEELQFSVFLQWLDVSASETRPPAFCVIWLTLFPCKTGAYKHDWYEIKLAGTRQETSSNKTSLQQPRERFCCCGRYSGTEGLGPSGPVQSLNTKQNFKLYNRASINSARYRTRAGHGDLYESATEHLNSYTAPSKLDIRLWSLIITGETLNFILNCKSCEQTASQEVWMFLWPWAVSVNALSPEVFPSLT